MQQCALLLSGAVLLLGWPLLLGRFAAYDQIGVWALGQAWCILAMAIVTGHAANSYLRYVLGLFT